MILSYKKSFAYLLSQHIPIGEEDIARLIEYAPDNIEGDLAFPCFQLAKELRKAPPMIAKDLTNTLNQSEDQPLRFVAVGPYLNAVLTTEKLAHRLITTILDKPSTYGRGRSNHETVLVESPGPNTNKPLHLGHVRNMLLGNALANVLEYGGFQVKKVDIVNDRGIHICKSMLAYQLRGENAEPNKKSDHYVGDWYIRYATELKKEIEASCERYTKMDLSIEEEMYKDEPEILATVKNKIKEINNNIQEKEETINKLITKGHKEKGIGPDPMYLAKSGIKRAKKDLEARALANSKLDKDAQNMLRKRESGSKGERVLREKMRNRCLDGMHETYTRYGTHIDRAYAESEHYQMGADLIKREHKKGTFTTDEKGNIIYDFGEETYGKKVLLRHDGTSIYITQDIALGKIRYDDHMMDRMIYVVGNEQNYHFKVLFEIFKILGYDFADKCHHLSYGMIELPDGKMKSREGNVVDADTLASQLHTEAHTLIESRYPERSKEEKKEQAEAIAMSAIKFYILLQDAKNNFVFDPKASISFDGETGPYIQYTYVRCQSLLRKAKQIELPQVDLANIEAEGTHIHNLLFALARFPEVQEKAVSDYAPHYIARYTLDLAKAFNSFYHHQAILDENNPQKTANMIALVRATQHVMGVGLQLLGIERLEKM